MVDLIKFSKEQRRELARLGVLPQQVHALENFTLNFCEAWLQPPQPLNEIKKSLSVVSDGIGSAIRELKELQTAPTRTVKYAANLHLEVEMFERGISDITEIMSLLSDMEAIVKSAASFKISQARHTSADSLPIRRIDEALRRGYAAAYPGKGLPKDFPWPSSSDGSKFRQIVGVCYQAMKQKNEDPESAIRKYMRELSQQRQRYKLLAEDLGRSDS